MQRREFRNNELNGATSGRKLVMWQTNKERDGEDFPGYVIHSTDFSPNRKTPLERDIRVSSSREQIEELWSELASEAFTKGWAPVAGTGPAGGVSASSEQQQPPIKETSTLVTDEPPKKRGNKVQRSDEPT